MAVNQMTRYFDYAHSSEFFLSECFTSNCALAKEWDVKTQMLQKLHKLTDRMCMKRWGIIMTYSLHTCWRSLKNLGVSGGAVIKDDKIG